MSEHIIINILDLLDNLGESDTKNVLSEFSCPLNPEIENFLQNNALEFAKSKKSITYLVFDDEEQERFVGYFTLTHKSSLVPADFLTNASRRKIERYAELDDTTNSYDVSAFLLAQFGKNYSVENGKSISGDSLMDDVFCILKEVQHLIGGGVVFLECEENNPKLLNFYQSKINRFKQYGERISKKDKKKYLQLLRFF